MLKRKLARARGADDAFARLESSVEHMESALTESTKRGRELLKSQKEQQRLLQQGVTREDSGRKLVALRDDLRVAKERLRRGTDCNEADTLQYFS